MYLDSDLESIRAMVNMASLFVPATFCIARSERLGSILARLGGKTSILFTLVKPSEVSDEAISSSTF
ncbi:hypothetical protein D3C87_1620550 [compost metagenome]